MGENVRAAPSVRQGERGEQKICKFQPLLKRGALCLWSGGWWTAVYDVDVDLNKTLCQRIIKLNPESIESEAECFVWSVPVWLRSNSSGRPAFESPGGVWVFLVCVSNVGNVWNNPFFCHHHSGVTSQDYSVSRDHQQPIYIFCLCWGWAVSDKANPVRRRSQDLAKAGQVAAVRSLSPVITSADCWNL